MKNKKKFDFIVQSHHIFHLNMIVDWSCVVADAECRSSTAD
jgi:hypothetical protein